MLTPDPHLAVDYGLFSVRQASDAGIRRPELERGLRRGRWEQVERGILRDCGRPVQPGDELLIAVLRAGRGAVAAVDSAAEVLGWDLPSRPTKPQIIVPLGHSRPPTGQVYRAALSDADVTLCGVLPVTTAARTLLDIGAMRPLEHSVVIFDSALRAGSITLDELEHCLGNSRRKGVRTARTAFGLADPRSGSVPESQARLLFRRSGLPAPISQYAIYAGGVLIAIADFAWPWARVVAEIDGFRYHAADGDFQRDRERQNAMVQAGWTVIRFTPTDIRSAETYAVAQLCSALDWPVPAEITQTLLGATASLKESP